MGNRRRWSLDVIAVWAGRRPGDFVQRSLNGGLYRYAMEIMRRLCTVSGSPFGST